MMIFERIKKSLKEKYIFLIIMLLMSGLMIWDYYNDGIIKLNIILFSIFVVISTAVFFWKSALRKVILILSILILGFYMGKSLSPVTIIKNVFTDFRPEFLFVLIIPLVLALLIGRLYCGYICPFGAIQEILFIKKFKIKIPERINKILSYIKYIILILLIVTLLIDDSIISFAKNSSGIGGSGGLIKYLLIGLMLAFTVVLYRPFCRYFCPLGALLGLVSKFSSYKINPPNCNNCGKCNFYCKSRAMHNGNIDKKECILCRECVNNCAQIK